MCEMITAAIVDDDVEARAEVRAILEAYASQHSGDVLFDISEYASGEALLATYQSNVDIVFLDVEMGDVNGLETARAIRDRDGNVSLLFVTNIAQYAVYGYEVGALGYLLKPVNRFAFFRELDRCIAHKRSLDTADSLVFSTMNGMVRVPLDTVTYLECVRHKIIVHTLKGVYEFTGTLKSFLPQLEPCHFVMANSCYLVNLRHVMGVDQYACLMRDGANLAVSRRRRSGLLQALGDYFGKAV